MPLRLLLGLLLHAAPLAAHHKCCGPDLVLHRNDTHHHCAPPPPHTAPLQGLSNTDASVGFQAACQEQPFNATDVSAHCFDKRVMDDGATDLVSLVCEDDNTTGNSSPSIVSVRKCCPKGFIYCSETHMCTESDPKLNLDLDSIFSDTAPMYLDLNYKGLDCSETIVDLPPKTEVRLLENGSAIVHGRTMTAETFCVDGEVRDGSVIRVCRQTRTYCESNACVTKCCADGMSKVGKNCNHTASHGFKLKFHKTFAGVLPPTEYGLTQSLKCPMGKFVLRPDMSPSEKYYVQENGRLFVPLYSHVFAGDSYCLEHVEWPDGGMVGVFAFLCFGSIHTEVNYVKYILCATGLITSSVFLLLTLMVYSCLPSLQNLHGKTLMCHVASLLAAFVCLSTLQLAMNTLSVPICKILGFVLSYTFLAAFSWLNVMCFDIWWTFGSVRSVHSGSRKHRDRRRFLLYSAYSWGLPTVFATFTVVMNELGYMLPEDLQPSIGQNSCFLLRGTAARFVYFTGPISLQIACNIVFFVLTAWNCSKVRAEIQRIQSTVGDRCKKRYQADKAKLLMNVKLFVVMGVGWSLEIVSTFEIDPPWVFYLPDAANALQGLLIFCIFVLKRKVLYRLAKRLGIRVAGQAAGRDASRATQHSSSSRCYDPYRVRKSASSSTLCTTTTITGRISPTTSNHEKNSMHLT